MNTNVDFYFTEGCGRCAKGGTPECKVHTWPEELRQLRRVVLDCGLTEESKWGVPCYTFQNKNIVIVSAFKEYSALSFFKGVLLHDEEGILQKPGENSHAARLIKFTSPKQIIDLEPILKAYIFEAIEVEKAGIKLPEREKTELEYPEEFQQMIDTDVMLKTAFEALTPGRQKAYIYFFSQAKQSQTRISRIEKSLTQVFAGKGPNEM